MPEVVKRKYRVVLCKSFLPHASHVIMNAAILFFGAAVAAELQTRRGCRAG
jgi:hypothetical protein